MNWARRWLELAPEGEGRRSGVQLDALVQRRMYWFGVGFMLALAPIYGTLTALRGNPLRPWLVLALVFTALALNVSTTLRRGDYGHGLAWLHGSTFFTVMVGALMNVGVNTPAFWWLTVIPFASILSGHTRLGISLGALVVVYTAVAFSLQPAPAGADPLLSLRLHVAVALSTVYACAYLALATLWRQQLQRSLDRARHEATAAAEAKARFLANMSHEIRTPLGGVIGAAELLRSSRISDSQRAQLASLQEQSAKALLALINDVLDWSKLEAGKQALQNEAVYLRALVFESNELFAMAAFDKGIELSSSCDPDVPRRFVGDATRIRQIVNNLVSNAVKFTHRGGVHVHLSIGAPETHGRPRGVCIEVTDTGVGIAPGQLARLFQPFVQADASITRKYGGTGLGLSISHELARLMGGHIDVHSTAGIGSSFLLHLPLPADEEHGPPPQPRSRPDVLLASASPGLLRHVRTLLNELRIEPDLLEGLPNESQLASRRLLLLDAALLAPLGDFGAWMAHQSQRGLRVAVLAPLTADALPGTLPAGVLLYKPVRRAALAALLDTLADSPRPAPAEPAPQRNTSAPRVLLCEDNPVNQIIVQTMLVELGARCSVAANGVEALARLQADSFDLVLMDVHMPELDGLAATRRWREIEQRRGAGRVAIVAVTANTEGDDGAACRAAGMDGFLSKPFGMAALRGCLLEFAGSGSTV